MEIQPALEAEAVFKVALGKEDDLGLKGQNQGPRVFGTLAYAMTKDYSRLKRELDPWRESRDALYDNFVRRCELTKPKPDAEEGEDGEDERILRYPDPQDPEKGAPVFQTPIFPGRDIVQKVEGNQLKIVFVDSGEEVEDEVPDGASPAEANEIRDRNAKLRTTIRRDFGEKTEYVSDKFNDMLRQRVTFNVYFAKAELVDDLPKGLDMMPILWMFKDEEGDNLDMFQAPPEENEAPEVESSTNGKAEPQEA